MNELERLKTEKVRSTAFLEDILLQLFFEIWPDAILGALASQTCNDSNAAKARRETAYDEQAACLHSTAGTHAEHLEFYEWPVSDGGISAVLCIVCIWIMYE